MSGGTGYQAGLLSDCDITRSEMVTRRAGEVVSQGKATAILGHPLHALKWLADDLVRIGKPLRAGEFVITGAIGPAVSARPGMPLMQKSLAWGSSAPALPTKEVSQA
jgi:2-keto-4-pentenoate hydratase